MEINIAAIENVKENIQPLRKGRNAKSLAEVSADGTHKGRSKLEEIKEYISLALVSSVSFNRVLLIE